jgi:hypothetical protein
MNDETVNDETVNGHANANRKEGFTKQGKYSPYRLWARTRKSKLLRRRTARRLERADRNGPSDISHRKLLSKRWRFAANAIVEWGEGKDERRGV